MARGNPNSVTALRNYRVNMTPEQRKVLSQRISDGLKRYYQERLYPKNYSTVVMVPAERRTGIAVSVRSMEKGKYLKGSSRTVTILNLPSDPDLFMRAFEQHVRMIRDSMRKLAEDKPVRGKVIAL